MSPLLNDVVLRDSQNGGRKKANHSSGSETVAAAAVAAGVGSFISISGESLDNRCMNPKKATVTSCFQRAD